jgi:hypothetical protein
MMAGSGSALPARAARVGANRLHLRRELGDLKLSYRYSELLLRLHELEGKIARRDRFDAAWRFPQQTAGVPVKTCGDCTPSSGMMFWQGGSYALVWFDGCDQPAVWPRVDLELVEDAAE